MSSVSSKLNLNHAILILVFFWFTGFLSSDGFSTSISSVRENSRNKISRSESIFSLKKNKEIQNIQFITKPSAIHRRAEIRLIHLGQDAIKHQKKKNRRTQYNRKYQRLPKGSYMNSHLYTVKKGDTLFYIAWITDNNLTDLAYRNNILTPYKLSIGQTLIVGRTFGDSSLSSRKVIRINNTISHNKTKSVQSSDKAFIPNHVITNAKDQYSRILNKNNVKVVNSSPISISTVDSMRSTVPSTSSIPSISAWKWPTDGKIIENFSPSSVKNRGIDIAGNKGQPIIAAASGRIVYAGNALRGYGNLIIIKHNGNYLSAYAHNDMMLVREQQEVKAGQKIAIMGSTGTDSTRLHFEIRYKGKSVNPLQYLPQR